MKLLRFLFKPDLAAPLLALMFASAVCVALVVTRTILAGSVFYLFLVWNLFLAWLPLIFALLLREQHIQGVRRRWRLAAWGATWLLFFPNAPYIVTDLTHLTNKFHGHYWTDMLLILSCALTGLMVGFVSLYVVQSVVADRFGLVTGWLFIMGVAGLSGVGVFMGRFLRLNSWDVAWRPVTMFHYAYDWLADPFASARPYVFSALFAVFMFTAYLMFYMLTKLPTTERISKMRQPWGSRRAFPLASGSGLTSNGRGGLQPGRRASVLNENRTARHTKILPVGVCTGQGVIGDRAGADRDAAGAEWCRENDANTPAGGNRGTGQG